MNRIHNRWSLLSVPPSLSFEIALVLDNEALSPSLLQFLTSELQRSHPHLLVPIPLRELLSSALLQKRYLLADARLLVSPKALPSSLPAPQASFPLRSNLSPQQALHEISAHIEQFLPPSSPSLQSPWRLPPLALPPASALRPLAPALASLPSPFENELASPPPSGDDLTFSSPFSSDAITKIQPARPPSRGSSPRFSPPPSSRLPWFLLALVSLAFAVTLLVRSFRHSPSNDPSPTFGSTLPRPQPPSPSPSAHPQPPPPSPALPGSSSPGSSSPGSLSPPHSSSPNARRPLPTEPSQRPVPPRTEPSPPPEPSQRPAAPPPPRLDPESLAFHSSWIGGTCASLQGCAFPQSLCLQGFPGGGCSSLCTSSCPPPPSRLKDQASPLACVPSSVIAQILPSFPDLRSGLCLPLCDYDRFPKSGCRTGFTCQMHPIFRSKRRKTVCVPSPAPAP